ncbi:MAG: glycerol-3-phosphate dehydrogenase [Burkholderiales bacterium]
MGTVYDLLVIGGGINGAGIARDAAGRGLSVLLVEQDDIASATSQWSTKLIHGGLRYLEYYEFRLVAEALAEREVVLRIAPHLVHPLSFVLPHEPHLRPAWMIRVGLFLYDHLGGRKTLPGSYGVDLAAGKWSAGLKHRFRKGFVYSDAQVDDARLVLVNALDAKERGAVVRTRTKLVAAAREGGLWKATLASGGAQEQVAARALVNTAGPWVKDVLDLVRTPKAGEGNVRHVKGSHIVVPRVHEEAHAYILQNADNRIVFVIPYQDRYSLIGTTDIPVDDFEHPHISDDEVQYLLDLANVYLERPLSRADIAWTYSGVRPLYDDGASDPSAVTRDYVLKVDADGGAPVLSSFGGKITTYRKLAEHALRELAPFFPGMKAPWTASEPLPGGDIPGANFDAWVAELRGRYPGIDAATATALAHRHGSRATRVLGDAKTIRDLGRHFGAGLTQREVDYLVQEEWAVTAEDVLWRRTKCGLPMTQAQRDAVAGYLP